MTWNSEGLSNKSDLFSSWSWFKLGVENELLNSSWAIS